MDLGRLASFWGSLGPNGGQGSLAFCTFYKLQAPKAERGIQKRRGRGAQGVPGGHKETEASASTREALELY